MSRIIATKSLPAAAVIGLFATHVATAQQTQSQPANCTTHFVYFSTSSHVLTPEDQDHIRNVAAMMQSTPKFVATIVGKTDSVGSADFNEHLSQRRAEAVFEALVYTNKYQRTSCNCAGLASDYHLYLVPMKRQSCTTGWLRLSSATQRRDIAADEHAVGVRSRHRTAIAYRSSADASYYTA